MSISISSIFLMSVLVLGFASYPPLLPNSENGVDAIDDLQLQLGSMAFAQEENGEEQEEEEIELRGIIASIGPGNQLTLESGEVILTDENTDFDDFTALDDLEVGFEVDIDAVLIDGNLLATQIEVEEKEEAEEKEEVGEVEPILFNTETPELKIRAETLGDQSEVKVKLKFSTSNTDIDSLIDEIIDEFSLSREQADDALKIEEEDDGELEEKFEVEVEIKDGIADVEVELRFVLDSTDREDILDAIVENTQLTTEQIQGSLDLEIEEEFEVEKEDGFEEEDYEIEVEVKKGKAKIKIELDDEKYRFVLTGNPTENEIITAIVDKTGLEPSFITSIWEFEAEEAEEDGEEEELSIEKQAKLTEKIAKHELKAQEKAEETILKLQQKIDQLEQRLQKLLDKFEAGEYYGTIPEPDPVTTSYIISFDGSATSLNDDSVVTDIDGEIFLETQVTRSDTTKFRVTGGEILVGDTFYDFVIGKARVSSSGTSGEKDSLLILGQVMDDQGNVNTIKIFLNSVTPLTGDFGLEPIDLEIKMPQSKIAKHWSLSASGQLSLLQS